MAWLFGIAGEFGPDEASAREFGRFIANFSFEGQEVEQCVFKDILGNYWVHAWLPELPEQKHKLAKEALEQFCHAAPPFRYALAGLETDEFRYFDELMEDLPDLKIDGLMVSESIWEEAGKPEQFQAFGEGRWICRV